MPDNEPDTTEDVPSVEERLEKYKENSAPFSGDSHAADWYGDDEPDAPGL